MTLKSLFRKAYNRAREDSFVFGLVGKHNPDTTVDFTVTGRADYLWVTLADKTVVQARNEAGVPQTEDLPVKLRVEHGTHVIVGRSNNNQLAVPTPTPPSGVLPHLIEDHSDVVLTATAAGDYLSFDGDDWINLPFNETVEDVVAAQFTGNSGRVQASYNDTTGAITLILDVSAADRILYSTGVDAWAETPLTAFGRSLIDDADAAAGRTTLEVTQEHIEDYVGAMVTGNTETNIAVTYDDSTGKLNFVVTTNTEEVQDIAGAMWVDSTSVDATYNDAAGTLTAVIIDEYVQDLMSTVLVDTSSVDFAYNDGTGQITATVLPAGVDHNALANLATGDVHTHYLLLAGRSGGQRVTGIASTGYALEVYRNLTNTSTDSAVFRVHQDHAIDDQPAAVVVNDGTGDALQVFDGATKTFYIDETGKMWAVGAAEFSSTFLVKSGSAKSIHRTGANGTDLSGAFTLITETSSAMSDGFGTGFIYVGVDSGNPSGVSLGITGAVRDGADTTSQLRGYAYLSGAAKIVYAFKANRQVFFNELTSGGANSLGIRPGTSSNDAAVGGVLFASTASQGNTGTGEDELLIPGTPGFSIPANTLAVNNQSIWFEASGIGAANSNSKILKVRFGSAGTNLIISQAVDLGGAASTWVVRGRIFRTGAATQKAYAEVQVNGLQTAAMVTNLNQTLSGAVVLRVTGEAVADNDIKIETFICGWDDANT